MAQEIATRENSIGRDAIAGKESDYTLAISAASEEVNGKTRPMQRAVDALNTLMKDCDVEKRADFISGYIQDAVEFNRRDDSTIDVQKVKDITKMVSATLEKEGFMKDDPGLRKAYAREMVDMAVEAQETKVVRSGYVQRTKDYFNEKSMKSKRDKDPRLKSRVVALVWLSNFKRGL